MSISRFDITALIPALEQESTLLVPNHRTMDAILYSWGHYQSHAKKDSARLSAWKRPAVYAIDVWLARLWSDVQYNCASSITGTALSAKIISEQEESLLWNRVLAGAQKEYPVLYTQETVKAVARAHRLSSQWQISDSQLNEFSGINDVRAFIYWRRSFLALCSKLEVVSLTDAISALVAQLQNAIASNTNLEGNTGHDEHENQLLSNIKDKLALLAGKANINIVNFLQPPPLYQALFDVLGEFTNIELLSSGTKTAPNQATHRSFIDQENEVTAAANWAQRLTAKEPHAHIGLVCLDTQKAGKYLDAYLRRFSSNPADKNFLTKNYNTYGNESSLSAAPAIRIGLSALKLNKPSIDTMDFCRLLQSELFVPVNVINSEEHTDSLLNATRKGNRVALEKRLRRVLESQTTTAKIREVMLQKGKPWYSPKLATTLLEFDELRRHSRSSQSSSEWLELFSQQLHLLGWPDAMLASNDSHLSFIFQQWQRLCERFQAMAGLIGRLALLDALAEFDKLAHSTLIAAPFRSQHNISLLKPEQAVDFNFDHLWILSMNDEQWPGKYSPANFIPYALQRDLQMPDSSPEQKLSESRLQLERLSKNCAGDLIYSYFKNEEDREHRPSSLVVGEWQLTDALSIKKDSTNHSSVQLVCESICDPEAIPFTDDEHLSGGSNLLNDQSACPFRAFAIHRLQLRPLDDLPQGLSAADRGSALHEALKHFWNEVGNQSAAISLMEKPDRLSSIVDSSITPAIQWLTRRYPNTMLPRFAQLEAQRLKSLVIGLLGVECQRAYFEVVETESRYQQNFRNFHLNLTIDRIDRLDNGQIVVTDYKTGRNIRYNWMQGELPLRPDDLQLPIYLFAVRSNKESGKVQTDTPAASLICQVNAWDIAYHGITACSLPVPEKLKSPAFKSVKHFAEEWLNIQKQWEAVINKIADEFQQGLCSVNPSFDENSCRYCDHSPLCRIKELRIQARLNQ